MFQDISIIGLDENSSTRTTGPHTALFDIVLTLSCSAPGEWSNYFDKRWQEHLYMSKRRAYASGSRIVITCVPSELEKEHIPELNQVIAETNAAYRAYSARVQAQTEERRKAEAKDKDIIQQLSKRISK